MCCTKTNLSFGTPFSMDRPKKPIENQIMTLEIKISDLYITQTFIHVDFNYLRIRCSTGPKFRTS